jgi:hypothetical protein
MPNEQIGIIGLKQVERKETAVVIDVTNIALEAFLKVYDSLSGILCLRTLMCFVCLH